MPDDIAILTTSSLLYIAAEAARTNKNRQVKREFIDQVDPNGRHVVAFKMLHNDVEYRLHILCKILGRDDPVDVWLDVDPDIYQACVQLLPEEAIQQLRNIQDSL